MTCLDAHLGPCRRKLVSGARFGLSGPVCGGHYNRRYRAAQRDAPAAAAPPCSRCGTAGGFTRAGASRPDRFPVAGGVAGRAALLCHACRWERPVAEAGDGARAGVPATGPVRVSPREVRLRAWAVLSRAARKGDEREDERIRRIEMGPKLTPAEGARRAIAAYRATVGGANR